MNNTDFKKTLSKNKTFILDTVNNNLDIICRDFLVGGTTPACVFFIDGMVNKYEIDQCVINPLMANVDFPHKFDYILDNIVGFCEAKPKPTLGEAITSTLNGDAVLLIDGEPLAYAFGTRFWQTRSISEPPTNAVLKGPREGFTEDIKQNMTLLRRKLRTPNLIYKHFTIGRETQTNIIVTSIKGIADETLLQKIYTKLQAIDIDGVVDSSYLAKMLSASQYSIFKQIGTTEKPDILVAKMLEGRIGIIVDNNPIVLTLPFLLLEDFQDAEDYYTRPAFATFSRLVRFLAIFVAALLPAIFVSAKLFHLQILPLRFALTLTESVEGLPLSPSYEMLFTLIVFEILREASVRMPKLIGVALSVIGALVLGETAVSAGLISTPTLLVVAISGIALYSVPEQESSVALLRIVYLLIAGSTGIFGVLLGLLFTSSYLCELSQYGAPYLSPFAPFIWSDQKDGLFKASLMDMRARPLSFPNVNSTKMDI